MRFGRKPFVGRVLAASLWVTLWAGTAGQALETLDFRFPGASAALAKDLRAASILQASQASGAVEAQDLFADARAEYGNLLGALYARGYYSPVIHVLIDGREAAAIAPLDAPARIGRIEVVVEAGPVFTFGRARIAPLAPGTRLPKGFAAGRVAESGLVLEAVGAAVDGWRGAGHAKARPGAQNLEADHARALLDAEVQIAPGPKLRFGPLVIEGHVRMREGRIRKIAGLPEGTVYDPEMLKRAAARLRRSGVFKSVTLSEAEAITAPDLLGITAVVVEERTRRYSFLAEIASFEGLTLDGTWLHRNLNGGGERLTINGGIANIGGQTGGVDYSVNLKLERPATFTPDTTAGLHLGFAQLNEQDYTADTFGAAFTLAHVFSESLTGTAEIGYAYAGISDLSGKTTYRSLELPLGAVWDRRDSKTDATHGFYIAAEAKPFLGFGTTDNGLRMTLDARGYRGFGRDNAVVLAARVQAGAVLGASLIGTPRDDLFYSGGGGTVRGQPYQSLGVNVLRDQFNTQFSTGGSYFLGASVETRVKVSDSFGVVGFFDVGRIDVGGFAGSGGDWHAGAGLGLRYLTSVGPIRLDLAVPVRGRTGDGLQIYVGLGQAF